MAASAEKIYNVTVTETKMTTIEIMASSSEEAKELVESRYSHGSYDGIWTDTLDIEVESEDEEERHLCDICGCDRGHHEVSKRNYLIPCESDGEWSEEESASFTEDTSLCVDLSGTKEEAQKVLKEYERQLQQACAAAEQMDKVIEQIQQT